MYYRGAVECAQKDDESFFCVEQVEPALGNRIRSKMHLSSHSSKCAFLRLKRPTLKVWLPAFPIPCRIRHVLPPRPRFCKSTVTTIILFFFFFSLLVLSRVVSRHSARWGNLKLRHSYYSIVSGTNCSVSNAFRHRYGFAREMRNVLQHIPESIP